MTVLDDDDPLKIYTTLGYIFNQKMFHQEASVETIKMMMTQLGQNASQVCHNCKVL